MEAENVPHTRSPVTTFWEGEILDNVHYNFFTKRWGSSEETDMKHWCKFDSFMPIKVSRGPWRALVLWVLSRSSQAPSIIWGLDAAGVCQERPRTL